MTGRQLNTWISLFFGVGLIGTSIWSFALTSQGRLDAQSGVARWANIGGIAGIWFLWSLFARKSPSPPIP